METVSISKDKHISTDEAGRGVENRPSPALIETKRRPIVPEAPYFQNILPLQLKEHVLAVILAISDPNERRWPLSELGLTPDSTSEEIEKAVLVRIDDYLAKYDELKEMLPRRIEFTEKWFEENGLRPSQDIRDVPVVLYDSILSLTRPDDRRTAPTLASFRPDINAVVMSVSATETELAHEYGHAASYKPEGGRVGWANIDQRGNPINGRDNRWLDEGCAITAEIATSGISLEQYREKNPQYAMYYALTRTLREELGVSESDLMQGYLAESPERQDFERKVQERYGCSVFELGGMLIGDYGLERKNLALLTGEPVELEALDEPDEGGMYDKYQWLAKTFPNVTLRLKAERASQNIEGNSELITVPDGRETEAGSAKQILEDISALLDPAYLADKNEKFKVALVIEVTQRLQDLGAVESSSHNMLRVSKLIRAEPCLQDLNIRSVLAVQNPLIRDLHARIFQYLEGKGIKVEDETREGVERYCKEINTSERGELLSSYAQHGLLTLRSAYAKGLLRETSSTPGDVREYNLDLEGDEHNNIRGYLFSETNVTEELFTGRNGFFTVVAERGGEDIDHAIKNLSAVEVENRLRNSALFLIDPVQLPILPRAENPHDEDLVLQDVSPEAITYILVHMDNVSLAREAFGNHSGKVVGVGSTEVSLYQFPKETYSAPSYLAEVEAVVRKGGPVWGHIARLPVDTYPVAQP